MTLKNLTISLKTYGENEGKYIGEIEYEDPKGSVRVVLSPEISGEYLRLSSTLMQRFALDGMAQLHDAILKAVRTPPPTVDECKVSA